MTTRYRPGVLSRVLAWTDKLPGHGWWIYPLLYGLLFLWSFNGGFQAGNVVAIVVLASIFAIGLACFILPLWGIHERLVDEKESLLRDVEVRLSRLAEEMYRRIDAGQLEATKVITDALAGAGDVRKRIVDVPTWPWRPQLLSGFVSALLLPVAVYLLTRAVAAQLGS